MKRVIFKNQSGAIYNVFEMEDPEAKIQKELADQAAEGAVVTYEVIDVTKEKSLEECFKKRRQEYPDFDEIVEALLEKDNVKLNELKAKREAVKAKYPKPL